MGGRRAGSLSNLVGSGGEVTAAKSKLSRAVSSENPDAIASAAAKLITKSGVGLEALRFSLKLTPFISENARRLAKISPAKRDEEIRKAWSTVKNTSKISTSPELDNSVISAALATFGKGRN